MQFAMITDPFIGDEKSNERVPYRLVTEGRYASQQDTTYNIRGEGRGLEFDGYITTGPTVLLPVAVFYKLFGVGVVQARMVVFFYYILSSLTFFILTKRLFDINTAKIAASIYTIYPFIVEAGHRILGEIAALFFIFLGIYLLLIYIENNKYIFLILSGLSLGFAGLSKILAFLVVFGGFIWFFLSAIRLLKKRSYRAVYKTMWIILTFCFFAAVPVLLYFIVIISRIGWEGFLNNYLYYTAEFFASNKEHSIISSLKFFFPRLSWITYIVNNEAIVIFGLIACIYYFLVKNKKSSDGILITLLIVTFWFSNGMHRYSIYFTSFLIIIIAKFVRDFVIDKEFNLFDFNQPNGIIALSYIGLVLINIFYDIRFIYLGEPGHLYWFEITNHSLRLPFWKMIK